MVACSPFGPAGEFAASRHGVLTRSQAATFGVTPKVVRRLLRDGVIAEPVPGILTVVGSQPTWRQRLMVATCAAGGTGVAGARSAAALHGIDGYPPGPVEILLRSYRRIELPGLVIRRGPMDADDVSMIDGIRVTAVPRTLCDLGTVDSPARLSIAFDWAWRQGCDLDLIASTAHRLLAPRRPGARRVLDLVDAAARHGRPRESPLEAAVEVVIGGLPGLCRQYDVRRSDGSFVARVDFAIPDLQIAIEAHSRRHHFGLVAEESDAEREAALQAEGWIVRYVTDAQRRAPRRLRASLLELIEARSRRSV